MYIDTYMHLSINVITHTYICRQLKKKQAIAFLDLQ